MSPEEKKQMVLSMCICKSCPTWVEGAEPIGFCNALIGKNPKITSDKGCICPTCPVFSKMSLTKDYYCIKGSEPEQKGMM
ncbi:MAG: DUF2769 domain-containing protein [Promethearchaeota archaeon]